MSSKSRARGTSSPKVWGVVLVATLAAGTAALSIAAVAHGQPELPASATTPTVAPAPTAEPIETSAPTPTPSAEPGATSLAAIPRAEERMLLLDSAGTTWRAVAGSCAAGEPALLERSADGGATWSDVTPRYLGMTQIAALLPFEPGEAQLLATIGANCDAQGLRTYTQGTFWEPNPDVLIASSYLPPANPSAVATPIGAPAAPCAEPTSLAVDGNSAALICGTEPYVWSVATGAGWVKVAGAPARATLVADGTLTLARVTADCAGVAVSTAALADPSSVQTTCLLGLDQAGAIALASAPNGSVVIWSGDTLTPIE